MRRAADRGGRPVLIAVAALGLAAIALAAASPLLSGRAAVWIAGGFAGILALAVLPFQPLLAAGLVAPPRGLRLHRVLGAAILLLVLAHVAGLWLYSPEDIADALLLRAPAAFSFWGVAGLAALLAAALVTLLRRRLPPRAWRRLHLGLAGLGALASVVHAVLVDGAMEPWSKALLCLATLAAVALAAVRRA